MRTSESKSVPILEEVDEDYTESSCYENISSCDFESERDYYTQIRFALEYFKLV